MSCGLDEIKVYANRVGELGSIGYKPEDTDRPGDGRRLSVDLAGSCRHVVAAGCCVVAHRDHDRLGLLRLVYSVPQLFGYVAATTGRIDTDDDSVVVLILSHV